MACWAFCEGYDKEEEEEIWGGQCGAAGGLERVTWVQVTPLSSTAESLGQETSRLLQPGPPVASGPDFISA